MSRRYKVLCSTPNDYCSGGRLQTDMRSQKKKCHNTHDEAYRCYVKYLISQGYTQYPNREFAPPGGGPRLVLTKRSRYGMHMRRGKEDRYMPKQFTGGGIVS